jgi:hypothetical protein
MSHFLFLTYIYMQLLRDINFLYLCTKIRESLPAVYKGYQASFDNLILLIKKEITRLASWRRSSD